MESKHLLPSLSERKVVGHDSSVLAEHARASWRDVLPVHPAANLFPLMAPDELKALGEDIQKNGLTSPIVFCLADNGKGRLLIDGRNRLDAMESLGRKLVNRYGKLALDLMDQRGLENNADPYAYVLSANIHRRHLTCVYRKPHPC
jgi:hypothetical protein